MDIDFLRRLHNKVNVVLVIAKADSLTTNELKKLKANILNDLETHKIQLYQFPDCDSDEDEDFKQQDRELKESIPFAVVASNSLVEVGGRKVIWVYSFEPFWIRKWACLYECAYKTVIVAKRVEYC